jgi:hypothetical protein
MIYRLITLILFLTFSCTMQKREDSKTENTSQYVDKDKSVSEHSSETGKTETLFKAIDLSSGQVQLELPSQLQEMDAEMFRLKYPLENTETTKAYSNEDGTVSLLISPRPEKATQTDLPKYQQMLYESFGKNSNIDFRKSEIRKINGRDFVVIEMVTPAVDTEVYNLMFVTSSGGRLVMGTFNCTVDRQKEWQPLAERILGSVKVRD